ncbi:MAG: hypothetical protein LBR64_02200 [Dysgonamonadaceae bacterium]|jgi:hypothetical protein|nr:hypothetical protein [Dysgonamonadaceae bacterium]
MAKKFFLFSMLFAIAVSAYGQDCNCESSFEWAKKTFEENDAGFRYGVNKKVVTEYEKHSAAIAEKTKSAKNNYECAEIITEWLYFFRKGHIGIEVLKNDYVADNLEDTIKTFPDWEKIEIDTVEFKKYLDEKKDFDIEGIWNDNSWTYKIGIKKIDNQYVGFVIESPDKCFRLFFASIERVDFEDYPIDGIGIQPDFYLDRGIPEYQWIDYIKGILEYGD